MRERLQVPTIEPRAPKAQEVPVPRRAGDPRRPEETIRLVFVEPRGLLGAGVREILDREPGIEVIAEVRTADEALAVVEETAPDIVLVDVGIQEPSVTGATRRIKQEAPDSAIVVVGSDDDDESILGAIEVGAAARIADDAEPAELVATIRRVADGEDPLKEELIGRPDLVERIVDAAREGFLHHERPSAILITPRELDVLRHVARGLRNREISEQLEVSEQTVKNHLSSIMHKLGVPNRTQAVTYAVRQGWLTLDEVTDLHGVPNR